MSGHGEAWKKYAENSPFSYFVNQIDALRDDSGGPWKMSISLPVATLKKKGATVRSFALLEPPKEVQFDWTTDGVTDTAAILSVNWQTYMAEGRFEEADMETMYKTAQAFTWLFKNMPNISFCCRLIIAKKGDDGVEGSVSWRKALIGRTQHVSFQVSEKISTAAPVKWIDKR